MTPPAVRPNQAGKVSQVKSKGSKRPRSSDDVEIRPKKQKPGSDPVNDGTTERMKAKFQQLKPILDMFDALLSQKRITGKHSKKAKSPAMQFIEGFVSQVSSSQDPAAHAYTKYTIDRLLKALGGATRRKICASTLTLLLHKCEFLSFRQIMDGVKEHLKMSLAKDREQVAKGKMLAFKALLECGRQFSNEEAGELIEATVKLSDKFRSSRIFATEGIARFLRTMDGGQAAAIAFPLLEDRVRKAPKGGYVHYEPEELLWAMELQRALQSYSPKPQSTIEKFMNYDFCEPKSLSAIQASLLPRVLQFEQMHLVWERLLSIIFSKSCAEEVFTSFWKIFVNYTVSEQCPGRPYSELVKHIMKISVEYIMNFKDEHTQTELLFLMHVWSPLLLRKVLLAYEQKYSAGDLYSFEIDNRLKRQFLDVVLFTEAVQNEDQSRQQEAGLSSGSLEKKKNATQVSEFNSSAVDEEEENEEEEEDVMVTMDDIMGIMDEHQKDSKIKPNTDKLEKKPRIYRSPHDQYLQRSPQYFRTTLQRLCAMLLYKRSLWRVAAFNQQLSSKTEKKSEIPIETSKRSVVDCLQFIGGNALFFLPPDANRSDVVRALDIKKNLRKELFDHLWGLLGSLSFSCYDIALEIALWHSGMEKTHRCRFKDLAHLSTKKEEISKYPKDIQTVLKCRKQLIRALKEFKSCEPTSALEKGIASFISYSYLYVTAFRDEQLAVTIMEFVSLFTAAKASGVSVLSGDNGVVFTEISLSFSAYEIALITHGMSVHKPLGVLKKIFGSLFQLGCKELGAGAINVLTEALNDAALIEIKEVEDEDAGEGDDVEEKGDEKDGDEQETTKINAQHSSLSFQCKVLDYIQYYCTKNFTSPAIVGVIKKVFNLILNHMKSRNSIYNKSSNLLVEILKTRPAIVDDDRKTRRELIRNALLFLRDISPLPAEGKRRRIRRVYTLESNMGHKSHTDTKGKVSSLILSSLFWASSYLLKNAGEKLSFKSKDLVVADLKEEVRQVFRAALGCNSIFSHRAVSCLSSLAQRYSGLCVEIVLPEIVNCCLTTKKDASKPQPSGTGSALHGYKLGLLLDCFSNLSLSLRSDKSFADTSDTHVSLLTSFLLDDAIASRGMRKGDSLHHPVARCVKVLSKASLPAEASAAVSMLRERIAAAQAEKKSKTPSKRAQPLKNKKEAGDVEGDEMVE